MVLTSSAIADIEAVRSLAPPLLWEGPNLPVTAYPVLLDNGMVLEVGFKFTFIYFFWLCALLHNQRTGQLIYPAFGLWN